MGCASSQNIRCVSPEISPAGRRNRLKRSPRSSDTLHSFAASEPVDQRKEEPERLAEVAIEETGELGQKSVPNLGEISRNVEPEKNEIVVSVQPRMSEAEEPERVAEVAIEETGELGQKSVPNLREISQNVEPEKNEIVVNVQPIMSEAELVATGWPSWLVADAGEAINGLVPLKSCSFEKLEKIGQGTYSKVYRARSLETGKIVAVKKVRFDNLQPESVRFMAREIMILRTLDHPNIMKLEGIITSTLSSSLCLVFEYMEHDLLGLISSQEIKFTNSQIKCLMKQLLAALKHCHSRGIMHRDIKSSNILVNKQGVLKLADFGLGNFTKPMDEQVLTNRVVTLWYRPPELLLGSTNYGEEIDLWSVGCVLGELYFRKPLIKGRNEVEQLHKIFRLCGSPSEEYWKRSKLPLACVFKPQHPYERMISEECKELPKSAVSLMETLLSVESGKRGTAVSALNSEYFSTDPYPCEPSSLPMLPPSKAFDAKIRKQAGRMNGDATTKSGMNSRNNPKRFPKTLQESNDPCKVNPMKDDANSQVEQKKKNGGSGNGNAQQKRASNDSRASKKQADYTKANLSKASTLTQMKKSSTCTCTKWEKQADAFTRLHNQPPSRGQKSNGTEHKRYETDRQEKHDSSGQAKPVLRKPMRYTSTLLTHPLLSCLENYLRWIRRVRGG